ncbi:hypothetical protein X760_00005 [Mesorhizobium sp. LSHC422A00]|nr:hypothetical protein X760_00005 [Mesorhizobium sp. LSHC422A00]
MIERVPEEVDVAALPCCFGDHLADRCHQAGVIVGHNQPDALALTAALAVLTSVLVMVAFLRRNR